MNTIKISNMKCNGCVANVEKAQQGLPGLESVEVSLQQANAVLGGDFDLDEAFRRVSEAGYAAEKQD